jgi:acyl carrier protein
MTAEIQWAEFADAVANVAKVDPATITEDTGLVADLGLDSLALTELVVVLLDRFDAPHLAGRLDGREWEAATVGQLRNECRGPNRAATQLANPRAAHG